MKKRKSKVAAYVIVEVIRLKHVLKAQEATPRKAIVIWARDEYARLQELAC